MALAIILISLLAGFGYWVTAEQYSAQQTIFSALLQREAELTGLSFGSGEFDLTDKHQLQDLVERLHRNVSEVEYLQIYRPIAGKFEVLASTDITEVGTIEAESRKQRAYEQSEIITYRREVLHANNSDRVLSSQIIPIVPIVNDLSEVVALVEVGFSTKDVDGLLDVYQGNNSFFLTLFVLLSILLLLYVLWLRYQNKQLMGDTEQLILRKDELLATAAHDLHGPLIIVRQNMKEIMQGDIDDQKRWELYQQIMDTNEYLSKFLDDLLVVSRFERGKQQVFPRPHYIQETITKVFDQFRTRAEEKGLGLELRGDLANLPRVIIDPEKIGEVLTNYLSNAVKYSDQGTVVLSVDVRDDGEQDYIVVAVQDNGVGISPENQLKLFQSFSRVGETVKTHPGNGLGLYIVKQIVEEHGGSVSVKSEVGQGSTFFFSIPIPNVAVVAKQDSTGIPS